MFDVGGEGIDVGGEGIDVGGEGIDVGGEGIDVDVGGEFRVCVNLGFVTISSSALNFLKMSFFIQEQWLWFR
ncbi:MAG: hypothetical protein GY899_12535 [Verrucomicrobiaceae bacterium]|jgi:hypothetical protein|nr:hypothetical protein [Verrucomicrobiaceae bacterium]